MKKILLVLAAVWTTSLWAADLAKAASDPQPARDVASQKVLFVDRAFIADSAGIRLAVHPLRKTGERTLVSEHPWENATLNWFTVLQEGGKFRMWYECYDIEGWPTADDTSFCYAESSDGIHWSKPKLGLFSYHGSTANNILFRQIGEGKARSRVHGSAVFCDPAAPPAERYKAVSQGLFQGVGERPYWIAGMTSPDGFRWNRIASPVCHVFADSQYSGFWDAELQQYVLYGRVGGRGRAIGRAASKQFDNFPPLSLVLQVDEGESPDGDLYNPACIRLPGRDGLYLMCPSLFRHKADTLDIHLATSRDGVHWTRPDPQTPLIPLGKPGEFDSGSLYMANGCALVGDEIWFYYSGSPLKHEETTPETLANPVNRRLFSRAVGLRDRLVSAMAGASGGTFLTPPLQYQGARLHVNIATRPGGTVRVGLIDRDGRPISGRQVEDCRPLGNADRPQVVAWKSGEDVAAWSKQGVRLRFELRDADVFGFQLLALPPPPDRQ
jgi:hypothetical protein